MRYLSVCSGIEAATVAWHPLGWEPVAFSEIEPFPCSVLNHHYPDVPNLGDMTNFALWPEKCSCKVCAATAPTSFQILGFTLKIYVCSHCGGLSIDLLCGGTPCQSFSVAGLRKGLADARGNLALVFLGILDRYRPKWVVWENVPGVLSSLSGGDPRPPGLPVDLEREGQRVETVEEYEELHALNCFLAGLSELSYGWSLRILDAQYFGVPQRRRRPFVVGYLGDWRRAAAVLFERHCLQGHPTPRRTAGKGVTHDIAPSLGASCRGFERGGDPRGQDPVVACEVAGTLSSNGKAAGSATQQDAESGLLVASALTTKSYADRGAEESKLVVTHPLGRNYGQECCVAIQNATRGKDQNGLGISEPGYPMYTLDQGSSHAIAIQAGAVRENPESGPDGVGIRDDGAAYTLEARQEVQAVAFDSRMRGAEPAVGREERPPQTMIERTGAIDATKPWNVAVGMAVRRLTPRECERLMGFPDNYTLVPYHRGKPAADGPRYKALGNSWAVPCAAWIGKRIQMVEEIPC